MIMAAIAAEFSHRRHPGLDWSQQRATSYSNPSEFCDD
jgi:hypothetical protein